MDKHVTGGSYNNNTRTLIITREQRNDDNTVTQMDPVTVDLTPVAEHFKPTWYVEGQS